MMWCNQTLQVQIIPDRAIQNFFKCFSDFLWKGLSKIFWLERIFSLFFGKFTLQPSQIMAPTRISSLLKKQPMPSQVEHKEALSWGKGAQLSYLLYILDGSVYSHFINWVWISQGPSYLPVLCHVLPKNKGSEPTPKTVFRMGMLLLAVWKIWKN